MKSQRKRLKSLHLKQRQLTLAVGLIICTFAMSCTTELVTEMPSEINFDGTQPLKVAVLPFDALKPEYKSGADFIRKSLCAHLRESNLDLVELYKVDAILKQNGWEDPVTQVAVGARKIGEALDADAVIFGMVTMWEKPYFVAHAHAQVGLQIEMKSTATEETLWKASKQNGKVSGILQFPIIIYLTPIPPVFFMLDDSVMYKVTNELTREMAQPLVQIAKEGRRATQPTYVALSKAEALDSQAEVELPEATNEPPKKVGHTEPKYTVQVCSSYNDEWTTLLVKRLRELNYDVYVHEGTFNGKPINHVRVGHYEDEAGADTELEKLTADVEEDETLSSLIKPLDRDYYITKCKSSAEHSSRFSGQ